MLPQKRCLFHLGQPVHVQRNLCKGMDMIPDEGFSLKEQFVVRNNHVNSKKSVSQTSLCMSSNVKINWQSNALAWVPLGQIQLDHKTSSLFSSSVIPKMNYKAEVRWIWNSVWEKLVEAPLSTFDHSNIHVSCFDSRI